MSGELKEVKYIKEIKVLKSSSKSRGAFITQASIYDGTFS